MFCRYCGKKIDDESKFCKYCGQPQGIITDERSVIDTTPNPEQIENPVQDEGYGKPVVVEDIEDDYTAPARPKKTVQRDNKPVKVRREEKNNKGLIAAAVAVASVLVLACIAFGVYKLVSNDNDNKVNNNILAESTKVNESAKETEQTTEGVTVEGTTQTTEGVTEEETTQTTEGMTEEETTQTIEEVTAPTTTDDMISETTQQITTERDTTEVSKAEQYIFKNSNAEKLTRSDVVGLTEWECKIARNEIYARRGRRFNDEELQKYFDGCQWYTGTIAPEDFSERMLSKIEKDNVTVISEYEHSKGYNNQ